MNHLNEYKFIYLLLAAAVSLSGVYWRLRLKHATLAAECTQDREDRKAEDLRVAVKIEKLETDVKHGAEVREELSRKAFALELEVSHVKELKISLTQKVDKLVESSAETNKLLSEHIAYHKGQETKKPRG